MRHERSTVCVKLRRRAVTDDASAPKAVVGLGKQRAKQSSVPGPTGLRMA